MSAHPVRPQIRRRDFLATALSVAVAVPGAATLGGCATLMTRRVTPVDGVIRVDPREYPELMRRGGAATLLPDGSSEPIFLVASGTSEPFSYQALSSRCTHRGCVVEYHGARFECPCHGSMYDRSGGVLHGPAQQPLTRYDVEAAGDGTLRIRLRPSGGPA
jgi:cytochrome b6-f complex iron-sulfur subunit